MTFPAVYPVSHETYCGMAWDTLNNEIPAWEDPVEVNVIGWRLNSVESLSDLGGAGGRSADYTSRVTTEGLLLTPVGLEVNVRDRFTLPAGPRGELQRFEVIETKYLGGNPWRWWPGNVMKIRRITPRGTT